MSELSRVSSDLMLINMWLHGRTETTTGAYRHNADYFLNFVGKPLAGVALEDLQFYATHLESSGIKDSSIRTKLNIIKSLFTFAAKLNYVRFNVAAALRIPKADNSLAGRILKQAEVLKLIEKGTKPGRDRALFKLMYATGMRVSEACQLKWCDFYEQDGGEIQVTVLGKGSKTRTVLVPPVVWMQVEELRGESAGHEPVFKNSKGDFLDRTVAHRIIKNAAVVSGVNPNVSCHFLRHSHATHAIAKGAPLALVRDSLGHSNIQTTDRYLHANPTDSSSNYLGL